MTLLAVLQALARWFETQIWVEPEPTPPPPPPSEDDLLLKMMMSLRTHEGWYSGSRSQRNNNPGNFKYSPVGYLAKYGTVKKDKDGFAIFKDYNTGWMYLRNHILTKAKKHPEWTLKQFFAEYAPPVENDTVRYASVVAKAMGVSPFTWQLRELL